MTPSHPEIEVAKDTVARCDSQIHRRRFDRYCFETPEMLLSPQAICIVHGVHAWQHNVKVYFQRCLGSSLRHLEERAVINYQSLNSSQ